MKKSIGDLFSVVLPCLVLVAFGALLLFACFKEYESINRSREQEKQIETLQSRIKAQDAELVSLKKKWYGPAGSVPILVEQDNREVRRLRLTVADLRGHIKELDNYIWGHRL